MAFEYREGSFHSSLHPEVVGRELNRIYDEFGVLHPDVVVEKARPPRSPLHAAFEWDDQKAAESHRIWQARTLIKSVVVTQPDHAPQTVYVNVRMTDPDKRGYHPLETVIRQPVMLELALMDIRKKLDSLSGSLDTLMEASRENPQGQSREIKKVIRAVQQARESAASLGIG